jgi:hypothetical protein
LPSFNGVAKSSPASTVSLVVALLISAHQFPRPAGEGEGLKNPKFEVRKAYSADDSSSFFHSPTLGIQQDGA